jgi:GT2 family glycosyltransferase
MSLQQKTVSYIPKIHIVIPVFNGWKQTKVCLDALRSSEYKNLEIILVDHGSMDETKNILPIEYSEVVYITGDSSLWWTGAINLGIRTAISRGAQRIMLLNNDCYITPKTVSTLTRHSEQAGEVIIASVQKDYDTDEIICTSCREYISLGFPSHSSSAIGKNAYDSSDLVPSQLIIGGRGVIIPTSVFKRIGVFDEVDFPHYYADHDFYLRCRKQGVPIFVAMDSIVYIDNSKTSTAVRPGEMTLTEFYQTLFSRRSHRNLRDLTVFFKKHYPIRGLFYIGLVLNVTRYFFIYLWQRTRYRIFR